MNKKEKILAQLSNQKKSLTKYKLSLMTDLRAAIEDMKSYDLQSSFDNAFTEYEYALGLMQEAKKAADTYIEASRKFDDDMSEQWDYYLNAKDIYFEVTDQLQDLGVPESQEITDMGNDIANAESEGQDAYSKYESDFSEHNELVDISNYN
tara:strand:- start:938 stop:1390 length:453 start_codon:yes stop_codon:yes gene_type:complete